MQVDLACPLGSALYVFVKFFNHQLEDIKITTMIDVCILSIKCSIRLGMIGLIVPPDAEV